MRKYGPKFKETKGQQFRVSEVSDASITLLAEAILQDAVKVYTSARKRIERLKKNPPETWTKSQWERWRKCCRDLSEVESFFMSEYFELFTPSGFDGRSVMRILNERPPANPNRKPAVRHQKSKQL